MSQHVLYAFVVRCGIETCRNGENILYELYGCISGHTFPVEEMFLEDILDKTDYVLEENSVNARKMKKSGTSFPGDMTSLECELETADIQGAAAVIKNSATQDENLNVTQLYYRYKGKFCCTVCFVQASLQQLAMCDATRC